MKRAIVLGVLLAAGGLSLAAAGFQAPAGQGCAARRDRMSPKSRRCTIACT